QAAAYDGAAVRNAAVVAQQVPISGIEGEDFAGVVATFTSANPFETAADFTAVIDWGDGTPTTTGSVTADPTRPLFLVTGVHHYGVAADYASPATVSERDGLSVRPPTPAGAADLQAGRRTFTNLAQSVSTQLRALGDFNRDGLLDIAVPQTANPMGYPS